MKKNTNKQQEYKAIIDDVLKPALKDRTINAATAKKMLSKRYPFLSNEEIEIDLSFTVYEPQEIKNG
jgi:hypothetical protein